MKLYVRANDSDFVNVTKVHIKVKDVNDESPQFKGVDRFEISEVVDIS